MTSDTGFLRGLGRSSAYLRRSKSWGCLLPANNIWCNFFLGLALHMIGWCGHFYTKNCIAHNDNLSKLRPMLIHKSILLFSSSTTIMQTRFLCTFHLYWSLEFKKNFMNSFPITRGDGKFLMVFELRQSRYRFVSASLNLLHETSSCIKSLSFICMLLPSLTSFYYPFDFSGSITKSASMPCSSGSNASFPCQL